jgi:hypothetical protein
VGAALPRSADPVHVLLPAALADLRAHHGLIAFVSAIGASGGAVAHLAHLGGLLVGWMYLKGPTDLRLDLNYRLTKWRMERMRRKFNVHRGGRDDDWERRIH